MAAWIISGMYLVNYFGHWQDMDFSPPVAKVALKWGLIATWFGSIAVMVVWQ